MLFSTNINFLHTKISEKSLRNKLPHFSVEKWSADSERSRKMIEGVFPRIFRNAFFDVRKAKKKSNTPICVESGETARRALWGTSSRRVLSHHYKEINQGMLGLAMSWLLCFSSPKNKVPRSLPGSASLVDHGW